MTDEDAELLDRSILYKGFFEMALHTIRHRLFAGGMSPPFTREIFERPPVAAVLLYDPDRDSVVQIEQFRAGKMASGRPNPWMVEIVAGIIEPGETAEDMAHREAMEEAGCTILALEPIVNFYPSPGGCSEFVYMYCGRVDSAGVGGIHGLDDENEDIRVFVEKTDDALARLAKGEIESSIGVIGLQWLALNRDRLRATWT